MVIKHLGRRKAIGAAAGVAAAAALYSPRSEAFLNCITLGSSVGEAAGDAVGDSFNGAWGNWLDSKNKDVDEDNNELASLMVTVQDGINHVMATTADLSARRFTATLPPDCVTESNRQATQALEYTQEAAEDISNKTLNEATLTMAAPFVRPRNRSQSFQNDFGDDWLELTTHANVLIRPTDIDGADDSALSDAFILNATGTTSANLALMTSDYVGFERTMYQQSSRAAAFTLGRAPLVRYQTFVTAAGGPSLRSTINQYVHDTYSNPSWRESTRMLESEVQAMQVLLKQKAFGNYMKLLRLRELELGVAILAAINLEKVESESRAS